MALKDKISTLPSDPGVYRFLNNEGIIIYIGKAKNLKKRVMQYFVDPGRLTRKTRVLVSKIADLEHTVVESEQDALLLENNLIKQYQPRYNILLKDSKTYPWICVKREPFPRVFLTRRFVKDGSLYFGPYSSVQHAHHLLDLINSLYRLRTCTLNLSDQAIGSGKYKECLNYHIKKCDAPCIGNISHEEYSAQIEGITNLLKGNTGTLIKEFKSKMQAAARDLDFEQAQIYKNNLDMLQQHYSKSLIVHPSITNIDVFSLVFEDYKVYGNFLRLNNGCIVKALNLEFKMNIEEEKEAMLSHFMQEIYNIAGEDIEKDNGGVALVKEVLVPFLPDQEFSGKHIHVPLKGDKLNLLELSTKNANAFKFQRLKQDALKYEDQTNVITPVQMLQNDLHMSVPPIHIECFDNSNIQGTNPVAACVVFRNGRPSKRDYRHFNIKTVVGANDYASMQEVVYRRYSRLLSEEAPLPQLILIDGGKGQLHFAHKALMELGLHEKIKIISIAERLEELYVPGDPMPLFLDKNSPSLKLLMHLRDEAHRFGITFHRNKRSKSQITSRLRDIEGIGEVTEEKLLKHFRSFKRVMEAPFDELAAVAGRKVAMAIDKKRDSAQQ
ncbi:MAG: excinuclease ABC subunit C [Bacteroidales bacterium]|nr:excinuclease ABC subunit C [Bacteroidales bacterium]